MNAPRLGALVPRDGVVVAVRDLGARLRHVTLASPALGQLGRFVPGQEFSLRPPGGWFREGGRTYSVLAYDRDAGRLEFVAFLHGLGPASRMLASLRPGDHVGVWGFGGPLHVDPAAAAHLIFGDESAVGAAVALAAAAHGTRGGAIEADPADAPAMVKALASLGGSALAVVARQAVRGAALVAWREHAASRGEATAATTAHYLLGHGQSVVLVRAAARRLGTPDARLHARAFWVDGRRG